MTRFLQPKALNEAIDLLNREDDICILAGGTDLIVGMRNKTVTPASIMDCKKIPELQELRIHEGNLEIGAAVTLNQIIESDTIKGAYDILKQAASETANSLLRNRATLAGNICNASPGGDMITACMVLDARLEVVSAKEKRVIALSEFFTGVKAHVLDKREMVTKIIFPRKDGRGVYLKKKRIRGHDLAQVGVSGFYGAEGDLTIALGAVGPTPILLKNICICEKDDIGENKTDIIAKAISRISPVTDLRSTKEYRIAMTKYLLNNALDSFAKSKEV